MKIWSGWRTTCRSTLGQGDALIEAEEVSSIGLLLDVIATFVMALRNSSGSESRASPTSSSNSFRGMSMPGFPFTSDWSA